MNGLVILLICVIFIAIGMMLVFVVRRQRQEAAERIEQAKNQALNRDVLHRARAKAQYQNHINMKNDGTTQDPLENMFGVEVPTEFKLKKKY